MQSLFHAANVILEVRTILLQIAVVLVNCEHLRLLIWGHFIPGLRVLPVQGAIRTLEEDPTGERKEQGPCTANHDEEGDQAWVGSQLF